MTTANQTGRILGTTDEVTTCDHCGRSDLKSTVVVETDGAINHYGCVCYAKFVGVPAADVRKSAKRADDTRREELRAAAQKQNDAEFAQWSAFCRRESRVGESYSTANAPLFTQIQILGGYAAAKALYMDWLMGIAAAECARAKAA